MARAAGILSALLVLVVLAGAAGKWIGIPYLERRWTYRPVVPDKPWALPAGGEKVTFTTSDGVRLNGWFLEGVAPRNGITVLLLHGNFGILPDYVPDAEIMRQRGFSVLMFNFRGFGISEGATESEATLDLDAAAALRYLTKQRGIDPRSIAFAGGSLGAPIAATLAAESPCRAVALFSSFASARRLAEINRPWLPEFVLDHLGSPFDTIGTIDDARCPVLVVHGAKDKVTLPQAREIYAAAPSPKRLIVVPGATHGSAAQTGRSIWTG